MVWRKNGRGEWCSPGLRAGEPGRGRDAMSLQLGRDDDEARAAGAVDADKNRRSGRDRGEKASVIRRSWPDQGGEHPGVRMGDRGT